MGLHVFDTTQLAKSDIHVAHWTALYQVDIRIHQT